MQLKLFKTLWGHKGNLANAAEQARKAGFDGIEGPVPRDPAGRRQLVRSLRMYDLEFIAEIATAGGYVPDRYARVEQHLHDLGCGLAAAAEVGARQVNCIGGCDAWPLADTLRFLESGMALAAEAGLRLSFETHRGRSLFTPWITQEVVSALPEIALTADFSHWCVVCERLIDSELTLIENIAPHVRHIHARVGYDQGPQVPHPAAPEYAEALEAHQRWWLTVWQAQRARGQQETTMTPEFGPDGYLQAAPFSGEPVADLWDINRWMAERERAHFAHAMPAH